jgi:hypothetical protein
LRTLWTEDTPCPQREKGIYLSAIEAGEMTGFKDDSLRAD